MKVGNDEIEEVYQFVKRSGIEEKLFTLKDHKAIHKIKVANLEKSEIKKQFIYKSTNKNQSDYYFEFNEKRDYYMFITIEENRKFTVNEVISKAKQEEKKSSFLSYQSFKNPNDFLNFDYNKYIISLVITHKPNPESDVEIWKTIYLNRETTVISHSTKESIEDFKYEEIGKKTEESLPFEYLIYSLENYHIIDVETRKPESEISIKNDEVQNICYILAHNKEQLVELYTLIKYSTFYIKEAMVNYTSKYIYNLIHTFTSFNETFLKCIENFGVILQKSDTQKIIFPLKQTVKSLRTLHYKNKLKHLNKNIKHLRKNKSLNSVVFSLFLKLFHKFDMFYIEKELKVKQKYLKKHKKKYGMLKNCCIFDEKNDKISKEHRIDTNKLFREMFKTIEDLLKAYSNDSVNIDIFFLMSLNKYINQYIAYNGFFNIDIIINEDSMVELNCCKKKSMINV